MIRGDFDNRLGELYSSKNEEEKLLNIKLIAELELTYFNFSSSMALLTEFKSAPVISDRDFFVTGLPFRYKTASILVTKASSSFDSVLKSFW